MTSTITATIVDWDKNDKVPAIHFGLKPKTYTVTFDSNGGSEVAEQTVIHGESVSAPDPAPTRPGCTLAGWTLDGEDYDFSDGVPEDITLVAKWSAETFYVDENGMRTENVTATVLGGSEKKLVPGTYFVNSDLTYDRTLTLGNGDIKFILGDGKTMRIGTDASPIQGSGIEKDYWMNQPALHIYGQTTDNDAAGSMEVYSTSGIYNIYSYTQHSGISIDMDMIAGKTLQPCILLTEWDPDDYDDRTGALTPWVGQDMTAAFQRTFNVGKASTICLPFPMEEVTDGDVYGFVGVTYDETDGWVATMQEPGETPLTANTPYLFIPSGDSETVDVTFSGSLADVTSIVAGETEAATGDGDWTFKGTYSYLEYEAEESDSNPFSGKAFGFAANSKGESEDNVQAGEFVRAAAGAYIPAFRAFLKYEGDETSLQVRATRSGGAGVPDRIAVRLLDRNGETQGIGEIRLSTGEVTFDSNAWYDLNGRRLAGKPTTKGIYINGGHKVVIK